MKKLIKCAAAVLALLTFAAGCASCSGGENGGNLTSSSSATGGGNKNDMTDIAFTKEFFENKKIVVYGDSITYGAGTSGAKAVWINKIATELGATYTNMAQNGAMLTYVAAKRDGRMSGCEFIDDNLAPAENYDYAFLFFGANDFTHGVPVGSVEEPADNLTEISSFVQGIKFAVNSLKKRNENIKIVFITSIYRDDVRKSSLGFEISAFANAIKENAAVLPYYYVDVSDIFNGENYGADSIYTADRLHPNDLGQTYLAEHIIAAGIKRGM